MFENCGKLISLDLSNFKTPAVYDMSNMFHNCTSLKNLKINFNTEKVTNMKNMFSNCLSLSSLDLSSFNTTICKNFENMFDNDENLDLYINNETCSNLVGTLPEYNNIHGVILN